MLAIGETFRVGQRDVHNELRRVRSEMTADLLQRLRDGKITARNLEGQRRSAFRGARTARAQLGRVLRGVGEKGMTHVASELVR